MSCLQELEGGPKIHRWYVLDRLHRSWGEARADLQGGSV